MTQGYFPLKTIKSPVFKKYTAISLAVLSMLNFKHR